MTRDELALLIVVAVGMVLMAASTLVAFGSIDPARQALEKLGLGG